MSERFPHTCPRCQGPAFVGFSSFECGHPLAPCHLIVDVYVHTQVRFPDPNMLVLLDEALQTLGLSDRRMRMTIEYDIVPATIEGDDMILYPSEMMISEGPNVDVVPGLTWSVALDMFGRYRWSKFLEYVGGRWRLMEVVEDGKEPIWRCTWTSRLEAA